MFVDNPYMTRKPNRFVLQQIGIILCSLFRFGKPLPKIKYSQLLTRHRIRWTCFYFAPRCCNASASDRKLWMISFNHLCSVLQLIFKPKYLAIQFFLFVWIFFGILVIAFFFKFKEYCSMLQKLCFPEFNQIGGCLIENPNFLNHLFSLDCFPGYLYPELLFIIFLHSKSYASLLFFCKNDFWSTFFYWNRDSVFRAHYSSSDSLDW